MEAWLTGTPAELDTAVQALTAAAYVSFVSERHPLAGVDAGHHRIYLRLAVTTTAPVPRRTGPTASGGASLIDLDTARAGRRGSHRRQHTR
ncbi:hypothetical protein [Micromonospora antibiotica]|uniref:Uncharacterized protein n=1 Tax=Micromonospora antibiotica TaxID=2807623 RepID=A0ABS3V127_9ACTN|nr:hypothetical protein [Micromonospora antibiotica]MBO4159313.1 hypothetical protein [Micromonospora antibiotica]